MYDGVIDSIEKFDKNNYKVQKIKCCLTCNYFLWLENNNMECSRIQHNVSSSVDPIGVCDKHKFKDGN